MDKKNKIFLGFFSFLSGILVSGTFFSFQEESILVPEQFLKPEISIVHFIDIKGDQLLADVSGPVRFVWGDSMKEGDGVHEIPLSQFPNTFDKEMWKYVYVGNSKTKKFYPSTSYPARGTEVKHRRFFNTKEGAITAGFIPSKLVK